MYYIQLYDIAQNVYKSKVWVLKCEKYVETIKGFLKTMQYSKFFSRCSDNCSFFLQKLWNLALFLDIILQCKVAFTIRKQFIILHHFDQSIDNFTELSSK